MIYSLKITDDLPEGTGGQAKFWFIKIRTQYKDDKGILEHEKVHVMQFWDYGIFHSLLYTFCATYRLWAEIQAYKVQLTYNPEYRDWYAQRITEMYNVTITKEEVLQKLSN